MSAVLQPVPVTVVSRVRREGWRGVLRDRGGTTVWRCDCAMPHPRPELAQRCAIEALGQRGSGFYPEGGLMAEWMAVPETDEERQALVEAIQSLPKPVEEDLRTLDIYRAQLMVSEDYAQIRHLQAAAEGIKKMFLANQEVRNRFDYAHLTGEWRIGQALLREEDAPGGQPYHAGSTGSPEERVATLAERVGNRTYGWRMKTIAPLSIEALYSFIQEYHQRDREATLTGIVKLVKAGDSAMRRMDSMTAPAIFQPEFRIGDSRVEMERDIEDGTVAMIMTDPPYEDGARPLWEWLPDWSERKLIDGGSLIIYFGHHNLDNLFDIFRGSRLKYWWICAMLHDQAQRLGGKFVAVNFKPILWYVKGYRRGRTIVPDVVYSNKRNKSEHAWGQGQGGVTQWIHQLTEPGELIVDPFCGTGEWGHISCREGRQWIGCDIVKGGTTSVLVDEIEE